MAGGLVIHCNSIQATIKVDKDNIDLTKYQSSFALFLLLWMAAFSF